MDTWIQLTILLSFIWVFRKESREDWLRCENIIRSMKEEMKDFHERLLKIEIERKDK